MSQAPPDLSMSPPPSDQPSPPLPRRSGTVYSLHGADRPDEYDWMRQPPAVAAHLAAERAYYEAMTMHTAPLRERLTKAMDARLAPVERSVEWTQAGQVHWTETPQGAEHERLVRRVPGGNKKFTQEILLDLAELAGGSPYVETGVREISPCGTLLAHSVDTVGEEIYELRFRDLATGRDLPERIARSYYTGAWSADSRAFLYTVPDDLYRPHEVRLHRLGTDPNDDPLVLREDDARFELTVAATRSGELITITAASRDTTEVWLVDAADPAAAPRSVAGRTPGTEYRVDHDAARGRLVVTTDRDAPESQAVTAPLDDPGQWSPLHPSRPGERLLHADAFAEHLVLTLRRDSAPLLRVVPFSPGAEPYELHPDLPAGRIAQVHNHTYDTGSIIVETGSYTEPTRWWSVDLATGGRTLLRTAEAPCHRSADYVSERRWAPAPDGTLVPVTLARRADTPLDGTAPCLMYAYGAYEAVDEPTYDPALATLLDQGVVFAHAHVRGGGELGRAWWRGGRLDTKPNTFTDHLAVADWLEAEQLVDGHRIATRGLSAGGLLQGAVFSRRPGRWACVVAEVPFVDVVTSMLDPEVPLTVNEWEEWGDPRRPEEFAWMLAYSPYDNPPPPAGRPPLLVTGAVNDPRVLVHEPAKWVARLRATADPARSAPVLFRVETGEGAHTGPAGRHSRLRYEAEVFAFVLDAFATGG
ncbi:prolyl oligopeptidase family serine peptidase [Streptomyces caeni]|uniref:Prolyl oligopeptidase family serine peptidase n=1 Tax=Streptomyces caeni TaxID=2307231 RepID=A0ABW4IX89_9ACTN